MNRGKKSQMEGRKLPTLETGLLGIIHNGIPYNEYRIVVPAPESKSSYAAVVVALVD